VNDIDGNAGGVSGCGQFRQIERVADTSARPPIAASRRQGGIDKKGPQAVVTLMMLTSIS